MQPKQFIPGLLLFLVSLILLCLPGSSLPGSPWLAAIHADKLVHIALFCLLVVLFAWPFRTSRSSGRSRTNWFLLMLFAAILYGVGMEFVQKYWVAGRSFEIQDIYADSAGALLGFGFSQWKFGGKGGKKIGPDRNRDRNQN